MSEPRVLIAPTAAQGLVQHVADPPTMTAGSALVSVIACALDFWDARLLSGDVAGTGWPVIPGRHFVGVIEALGAGLTEDVRGERLRPGTPVLVPSVAPCGTCVLCRAPLSHAPDCLTPRRLGVGGTDAPLSGGLAESVFVAHGAIHALPLTLPPWLATLAEPFAACLLAFARAQAIGRFPPGASVVVIGQDVTALLAVVAARELGAGRIILSGTPDRPFLRLGRLCGAEATIDTAEVGDPADRVAIVHETVGGRGADLVITASDRLAEGLACLREGGTLVTMSDTSNTVPAPMMAAKHLMVIGASGFRSADIPVALGMLFRARDRYPFAAMHGRFPFSPEGAAAALAELRAGTTVRALVTMRDDLVGLPTSGL